MGKMNHQSMMFKMRHKDWIAKTLITAYALPF